MRGRSLPAICPRAPARAPARTPPLDLCRPISPGAPAWQLRLSKSHAEALSRALQEQQQQQQGQQGQGHGQYAPPPTHAAPPPGRMGGGGMGGGGMGGGGMCGGGGMMGGGMGSGFQQAQSRASLFW